MNALLSNTTFVAYALVFLGAFFNLITAYMLKKAEGFTVFWPSFIALVCICLTQFLLSRAMRSGLDMSIADTLVVVTVMVGSCIMGVMLFSETLTVQKAAGLTIAVLGITLASLAK